GRATSEGSTPSKRVLYTWAACAKPVAPRLITWPRIGGPAMLDRATVRATAPALAPRPTVEPTAAARARKARRSSESLTGRDRRPPGALGVHVVERPALGALDEHAEQLALAHAFGQRLGAAAAQQAVGAIAVEGQLSLRRGVDDCACP